jgi:hypothetical protein
MDKLASEGDWPNVQALHVEAAAFDLPSLHNLRGKVAGRRRANICLEGPHESNVARLANGS